MLNEVAMLDQAGMKALTTAIGVLGPRLAAAAMKPRGRRVEDLSIARWFETYTVTAKLPELPGISDEATDLLVDVLSGDEIQAALQELLAVRLTDGSNAEARQARQVFRLTLATADPSLSSFGPTLAEFYDDQICEMVARLGAAEPAMLAQIRSEALSARMIATLRAIERHTAALSSRPNPRSEASFLASYRSHVIEQHGKLEPPDFDRRRRVPVADIYVPATIYEEIPPERTVAPVYQEPPSLSVWQLAGRLDRTVLLGEPGGGKTTASKVLMHHFASGEARRVPFLVTLRNYAASHPPERSVVGFIEHELETLYQCPAPSGLVDMLLLTGRAIVIFDGLDELLDTTRRADVATRVEHFCAEYPLAPVLVTSRVVGYDQARLDEAQFVSYRLGGFRDEDVADYACKWFALDEGAHAGEADAFLSESESVPDLRTNPLLLSLMCILYRGEGSLPRNRAEVYEQCANLLFRHWDARRHIHQELRAGRYVEPILRHLAWWLFSRDSVQTAVTERELVNVTTEFLHRRGFESQEDARDAACEFIEFCRGRMWVFTEAGTTAIGEKLYAFTHRTFLEYFAASQLAYDSDTPEKLSRTLAPRLAQGEWEVVGELAVQIKDTTSREGARRIYEALLDERRRRAVEGRSNVLQFLARSLRSVDPSPSVIRRVARESAAFLFSVNSDNVILALPLVMLLRNCRECLGLVDEEVAGFIGEMIGSGDPRAHLDGLLLGLSLDCVAYANWGEKITALPADDLLRNFWQDRVDQNATQYRSAIESAAVHNSNIRALALRYGFITIKQALSQQGGPLPLLQDQKIGKFGLWDGPYLITSFVRLALGLYAVDSPEFSSDIQDMTAAGEFIMNVRTPPWVAGRIPSWSDYKWNRASAEKLPGIASPIAYLGGAAVALMSAETDSRLPSTPLGGDPSKLGPFHALYAYIEMRHRQDAAIALHDLPVPEEFKQVFRDWAAGKVNFTAPASGPPGQNTP